MRNSGQRSAGEMRGTFRCSQLVLAGALLLLCSLILALLAAEGRTASGSTLADVSATPGAAQPPGKIAQVNTPPPTRPPARWERTALQALADALSWPTDVLEAPGGKFSVKLEASPNEWYQASIRAFETEPGGAAAFAADMEDMQLSGLTVVQTEFYSYPAYVATMEDDNEALVERHLTWHVDEWVMAVTVHGTSDEALDFDPQEAAHLLLYLAVQQGLAEPPGGIAPPDLQGGTPTVEPTPVDCGVTFDDVPENHWAGPFISRLACDGVVSGYADSTFRPQNPTTRAQLAKMLALAEDWDLASPVVATFTDVPTTHIFFRYVETAVREEVVSGFRDGTFRPDAYVTRAQVAKMLVHARGWSPVSAQVAGLCDVPRTHWAWSPIQTAIEHGAFRGYADGCFYPDAVATRAQLAKVLVNATD